MVIPPTGSIGDMQLNSYFFCHYITFSDSSMHADPTAWVFGTCLWHARELFTVPKSSACAKGREKHFGCAIGYSCWPEFMKMSPYATGGFDRLNLTLEDFSGCTRILCRC